MFLRRRKKNCRSTVSGHKFGKKFCAECALDTFCLVFLPLLWESRLSLLLFSLSLCVASRPVMITGREREREREAVWIRSDKKERTTRLCPQDGEGPFRSSRSFVSSGNFAQALKVQPQKVGAQKGFCSTEVKTNMILSTLFIKTDNMMKTNALGYFFPVWRASGGELIDNAICLHSSRVLL